MTTDKDLAWFVSWESLRVIAALIAVEQALHAISRRCGYECKDCSNLLRDVFICCARADGTPCDSAADVVI